MNRKIDWFCLNTRDKIRKKIADKHSQTKSELIFCYECEFSADDYHDLGEYMIEYNFYGEYEWYDEISTSEET